MYSNSPTSRIRETMKRYLISRPTTFYKLIAFRAIDPSTPIDASPKWFPGIQINLAENMLFGPGKEDSKIAVTSIREGNTSIIHTSWSQLRLQVGKIASALRASGTQKGDRVAVIASNNLHTMSVFLATVSIGAIFTSTSTDMGSKGILDRLAQIRPRLVFMEDFAVYGGKITDLRPKASEVVEFLHKTIEFDNLIMMPRFELLSNVSNIPRRYVFPKTILLNQSCSLILSLVARGRISCLWLPAPNLFLSVRHLIIRV